MCASAPKENPPRSHRRYAFPRRVRLLRAADFQRVFADPRRSSDRFFTVLARTNELGYARIGLAISRKVAPKAHQRNRLKRRARESFRQTRVELPGIDFVVMARPAAVFATDSDIRGSLSGHWQQLIRRCVDSSS